MTWLPQSQDLRIPANLTFPSIWSPLSSSKWVNNLCISLVEVNQASIVFENDLAARVSGYQAPAKVNPDWGFPHIFLFNFLEIFFDRHLDIWREQPCGQTRGRSKSCASCGAIPNSVSKKRDWGPHSNGKFENSFDRLGFWWNYWSIIQKPFIQKLWQPGHSQTFSWTWSDPEILAPVT